MGDSQRSGHSDRDIEQAIIALKRGATLLKYGRRGKPKFCSFRLSSDESALIWYSGNEEKQIKLSNVSKIIPGQRTAIFQRYPRPEKEYQSFSLICNDRTLDLICKDKDESEVWFAGLKALISNSNWRRWRSEARENTVSTDGLPAQRLPIASSDPRASNHSSVESSPQAGLGKAFSDIILYTASSKSHPQIESSVPSLSLQSPTTVDNSAARSSTTSDNFRVSLSSAVSSSSQGSCHEDFDSFGDVFIWGHGIGEGILGGGKLRADSSVNIQTDALLPKVLGSTVVLDVHQVACGDRHAVLVTRQGEIFSWGEELGGRLGHGVDIDVSHPKLIDNLSGMTIETVACGEYHTCAVTSSGDLFTWGDGTCNSGLLGHGSDIGHWIPKRVGGPMEGLHVSYVSCGPWHTAVVTSTGQLFTFGDGTFGALGHGDRTGCRIPRQVDALSGLRTVRAACGVWHTAAIVELDVGEDESSSSASFDRSSAANLFTWGDGDKGQLGHGDKEARLVPDRVASVLNLSFCKIACGRDVTVALTTTGRVYTMGSAIYGQLGCPEANGRTPACVEGKLIGCFVEDIACGSHHVVVLTSKAEVYTWGKGTNGQLGYGNNNHRSEPTSVNFLKDKQVKSVACGSNFTAVICLHKWVSGFDQSVCTACHNPFGFRRKRHNCYNCGQVFCKACSNRKSLKAALAPNMNKPYRVCDDCFSKLKKSMEVGTSVRIPRPAGKSNLQKPNERADQEASGPKLAGIVSRFSFVEPFKRSTSGNSRGPSFSSTSLPGNIQPESSQPSSAPAASGKHVSAFVPRGRMVSRSASPISMLFPSLSVPTSPEVAHDDFSQDILHLRAEVESLTSKNQLLESQLEKTLKQLREAKALAADEAEKSKAAKETIRSLTAQLKEKTVKLREGNSVCSKSISSSSQTSKAVSIGSREGHLTSLMSPRSESNINNTMDAVLARGAKGGHPDKTEWVVQDEPGIYITLCSLPGGGNELKRVRFSRKRFSEEQAEKWWAEHGTRVCERHNVRSS